MPTLKPYGKAAIAVAGLIVVLANTVLSGHYDLEAIVSAVTAVGVSLGVYSVKNAA